MGNALVQKRVDVDSLDSASPAPWPGRSPLMLVAAGGILHIIGETLALGASGALPSGMAFLIFGSSALAVTLFCAALWRSTKRQAAPPERKQPLSPARPSLPRQLAKSGLLMVLLLAALWSIAVNGALLI